MTSLSSVGTSTTNTSTSSTSSSTSNSSSHSKQLRAKIEQSKTPINKLTSKNNAAALTQQQSNNSKNTNVTPNNSGRTTTSQNYSHSSSTSTSSSCSPANKNEKQKGNVIDSSSKKVAANSHEQTTMTLTSSGEEMANVNTTKTEMSNENVNNTNNTSTSNRNTSQSRTNNTTTSSSTHDQTVSTDVLYNVDDNEDTNNKNNNNNNNRVNSHSYSHKDEIINQVNQLLQFCNIHNVVTNIRQCTSSFFVLIYQRLFDCTIPGIDRSPNTLEKKLQNIRLVLDELQRRHYNLEHISIEEVGKLNEEHISRLIHVFVQIAASMYRTQQQSQQQQSQQHERHHEHHNSHQNEFVQEEKALQLSYHTHPPMPLSHTQQWQPSLPTSSLSANVFDLYPSNAPNTGVSTNTNNTNIVPYTVAEVRPREFASFAPPPSSLLTSSHPIHSTISSSFSPAARSYAHEQHEEQEQRKVEERHYNNAQVQHNKSLHKNHIVNNSKPNNIINSLNNKKMENYNYNMKKVKKSTTELPDKRTLLTLTSTNEFNDFMDDLDKDLQFDKDKVKDKDNNSTTTSYDIASYSENSDTAASDMLAAHAHAIQPVQSKMLPLRPTTEEEQTKGKHVESHHIRPLQKVLQHGAYDTYNTMNNVNKNKRINLDHHNKEGLNVVTSTATINRGAEDAYNYQKYLKYDENIVDDDNYAAMNRQIEMYNGNLHEMNNNNNNNIYYHHHVNNNINVADNEEAENNDEALDENEDIDVDNDDDDDESSSAIPTDELVKNWYSGLITPVVHGIDARLHFDTNANTPLHHRRRHHSYERYYHEFSPESQKYHTENSRKPHEKTTKHNYNKYYSSDNKDKNRRRHSYELYFNEEDHEQEQLQNELHKTPQSKHYIFNSDNSKEGKAKQNANGAKGNTSLLKQKKSQDKLHASARRYVHQEPHPLTASPHKSSTTTTSIHENNHLPPSTLPQQHSRSSSSFDSTSMKAQQSQKQAKSSAHKTQIALPTELKTEDIIKRQRRLDKKLDAQIYDKMMYDQAKENKANKEWDDEEEETEQIQKEINNYGKKKMTDKVSFTKEQETKHKHPVGQPRLYENVIYSRRPHLQTNPVSVNTNTKTKKNQRSEEEMMEFTDFPLTHAEEQLFALHPHRLINAQERDRKIARLRAAKFLGSLQCDVRQKMRSSYDSSMRAMREKLDQSTHITRQAKWDLQRQVRDEDAKYRKAYAILIQAAVHDRKIPESMMSLHTLRLAQQYAAQLEASQVMCSRLAHEAERRNAVDLMQYASHISAWQQQLSV